MAIKSWLIWALFSAAFAAATAILAKLGLKTINSDFGLLVRTAVVLIAMGALVVMTGKWVPLAEVSPRAWLFLVLSGLATGASWYCYFRALKVGEVSRVAVIDKLSVVLVALFSAAALQERLGPLGWLGIALVGVGGILIGFQK
jgi:transporter family protein